MEACRVTGQFLILGRNRAKAHQLVDAAPLGAELRISQARRSDQANRRMWAMLSAISLAKPEGRTLTPDIWKALFCHALDHAQRFELALDGRGMVPVGFRTSRMTKAQMSTLMDFIDEYAARHGIDLGDTQQEAA